MLSAFGRLSKSNTFGISAVLIYDKHGNPAQNAVTDLIALNGDNADASQLLVTLHPPRVIPSSTEGQRLDIQNITGEMGNAEAVLSEFLDEDGDSHPIQWPPFDAVIEYGTGGTSTKFACDFANGMTVAVSGSFLRVHAVVGQGVSGDISGTSAAYRVSAHVGPGFGVNHITRTIYVGVLNHKEESEVFDVPKFGKRVSLVGTRSNGDDPSVTEGWIRFYQSPNGHHRVADFFFDKTTPPTVEFPSGAAYFSVLNKSGHHMKMSVIFGLAL